MQPKVSVIMPVYNRQEKWLREAIESILNQTFSDFEFIILNDGSTDENVEKVITSYDDKRIVFINNKYNQGFIGALNQCLDVAQGEYIAKMDSDDISLPERLEKQVNYLNTHPDIGLVGAGYRAFDKADHSLILKENVFLLDMLKECCTTLFLARRSIIAQNNLRFRKEFIHAEDYDFYARFMRYANIANLQEVLYLYRWHGENVSIKESDLQQQSANKIRKYIIDWLTDDSQMQNKLCDVIKFPHEKDCVKLGNIFSITKKVDKIKIHFIVKILGVKLSFSRRLK